MGVDTACSGSRIHRGYGSAVCQFDQLSGLLIAAPPHVPADLGNQCLPRQPRTDRRIQSRQCVHSARYPSHVNRGPGRIRREDTADHLQFRRFDPITVHHNLFRPRMLHAEHMCRLPVENSEAMQLRGGVISGGQRHRPDRQPCRLDPQYRRQRRIRLPINTMENPHPLPPIDPSSHLGTAVLTRHLPCGERTELTVPHLLQPWSHSHSIPCPPSPTPRISSTNSPPVDKSSPVDHEAAEPLVCQAGPGAPPRHRKGQTVAPNP